MPILVDTHCHLDFQRFDEDRAEVLARAAEVGVVRIVNPGVDVQSSRAALSLAEQYEMVYAAVGVHPNSAAAWSDDALRALRALAGHPKVAAIGEIGLDYYRDHATPADQRRALRAQLDLAAELELPVIIHCRDAHDDAYRLIEAWQSETGQRANATGVFHSFGGDTDHAARAVELGFLVGITGPVTFPKAEELRRIAVQAPLDRLLVETDAPFLAPQQQRGKRNEPAFVRWVVERIAVEREMETNDLALATTRNAEQLFGWNVLC